jgi:hypothetical protein
LEKALKTGMLVALAWIGGLLLLGLLLLLFILSPFRGAFGDTNYFKAREQSIRIFERRTDAFLRAKDEAVSKGNAEDISVRNVNSIWYTSNENYSIVEFFIDGQGMLGGQGWGIYYASNNLPSAHFDYGSNTAFGYNIFKKGPCENSYFVVNRDKGSFYATERIQEGWFFFYKDYDGNIHGLDWD